MISIHSYEQHDAGQVYTLWQQALGQLWPLSYEKFLAITTANSVYCVEDHFVARAGEEIVGWIATEISHKESSPQGNLLALLVSPAYRRKGVGKMLHDYALAFFKQHGIIRLQLGGGFDYFWQGVPTNLPQAWQFFQACGWSEEERSYDLVREMAGYVTPSGIYERLPATIKISQTLPADADAILAFEKQHFPNWLPYFQLVLQHDGYAEVVLAKEDNQGIVGTCLVDPPSDLRWKSLLGGNTGGIGTLGVAESMRNQGIGLALAARVTELVREQGRERSYIGWTWLVDWYGKLGYQIWQEYIMSWRYL